MLLRTTSLPTAQVAVSCGFHSPHHLIRSFKKVTGQTPGEYRRWAKSRKTGSTHDEEKVQPQPINLDLIDDEEG